MAATTSLCNFDIEKSEDWRIFQATTANWHQIWIWFGCTFKVFRVQMEILAATFDYISNQKVNLSLFLSEWYCRKLGLMNLPALHKTWSFPLRIKNFSSKCDQVGSFLKFWLHLLRISLMGNFSFVQCGKRQESDVR